MCTGGGFFSPPSAEAYAVKTIYIDTDDNDTVKLGSDAVLPAGAELTPAVGTSNTKSLTITGTSAWPAWSIIGGYPGTQSADGYSLTLNDFTNTDDGISQFIGAWGKSATNNTITLNNLNVTLYNGIEGAHAYNGSVENNQVIIAGGTITTGYIIGGNMTTTSLVNAVNNSITISDATVTASQSITGGGTSNGNATGNTITINSGTISTNNIVGGWASDGGDATGNSVIIKGGTVTGAVIGAQTDGTSNYGNAKDNTVTISGGTINGMVSGGVAMGTGNATDNTVNILAAITLQGINGGSVMSGTSSNNTINFAAKDVTITDNIYGAQNLNFYLPSDIAIGDTMVTINGGATDFTTTPVTIGAAAQTGVNLNQGDTVTLISNTNGFTGTAATTTLTTAPTATSLTLDTSYQFAINQGDTAITATVTDKTESSTESSMERAKSLVETRAATTTFINAGADMLSSQGFAQAANAVTLAAAEQAQNTAAGAPAANVFTPFAAIGGSSMRAQSGSYVDTKGFGLNVGFAREINNAQGKLLFGPVVEYGGGSYDSYLEDAAGTHGEGGAHYYGLGIMARQVNHDGLYYEGSLRGGRVNSDYKSTMDTLGKVDYDSSSNYFAAHLGVGKAFSIGNGNTLDGYLKYFYSHQAGDTTTIHIENAADERGSFSSVDSHRLRIGARLTHKVNDRNSFYGGLAYQYEFGGEARAHFSSGGNVPSPSVKGGSGMLELGWQVKPGETPLTLDLGLTGWAGKQRGGSIQLGATWKF